MKSTDKRIKYTDSGRPYVEQIVNYGKQKGYIRKKYGKILICKNCGEDCFVENRNIKSNGNFCNHKCQLIGKFHPHWKGGKTIDGNGYIMIKSYNHSNTNNKNYIQEHRLVMEKKLDRLLTKSEIVHHKNGVRDDNRIENLCVTDRKNHENKTFMKLLQKRIRELEKENKLLKGDN